ncbi:MAG: hypothetical protein J4431_00165 [Candidatus Aenigmarchaeota archaeon]|nr:hypothetical protein [Candidatus Aenigmarchaeota archaeon]
MRIIIVTMLLAALVAGCVQTGVETEPPKLSTPPAAMNVYGELIGQENSGIDTIFTIRTDFVDYETNSSVIEVATEPFPLNLTVGMKYAFAFEDSGFERIGLWDSINVSEDFTKYQKDGGFIHKYDMSFGDIYGNASSDLVQIKEDRVAANGETTLQAMIINNQNVPIAFEISNVMLIDKEIAMLDLRECGQGEEEFREISIPKVMGDNDTGDGTEIEHVCSKIPLSERLANSIISGCTANGTEGMVDAGSSYAVSFDVSCQTPIICEDGQCSIALIGDRKFTDELGNVHVIENAYLKQHLTVERADSEIPGNSP